ncbi:MAG: tetratricopeptide repeat protein [Planctomycetia bacterium]|nr:tetratricopeptide repeat protein [Planctomycetia bacterium]
MALNNLAVSYKTLSQASKALPYQLRSLAIQEKALGPLHSTTAVALSNLARIYFGYALS